MYQSTPQTLKNIFIFHMQETRYAQGACVFFLSFKVEQHYTWLRFSDLGPYPSLQQHVPEVSDTEFQRQNHMSGRSSI